MLLSLSEAIDFLSFWLSKRLLQCQLNKISNTSNQVLPSYICLASIRLEVPILKLLIVEDNKDFLASLQDEIWYLEKDLHWCVDIAQDIKDAQKKCQGKTYDLALVDIILPDGRGSELLEFFRTLGETIESVVISVLNDPRTVLECVKLGAVGYVDKTDFLDGTQSIYSVTQAFKNGQAPITGSIAKLILESMHQPQLRKAEPSIQLSDREQEVLNALSKGFTMKEVANILGISAQTVPVHARNIYKKLNANGKAEAVFIARGKGFIE